MERSEYCAQELLGIVRNPCSETYELFLTALERNELIKTCTDIRFFFDWNFKFNDFYGVIASYHYPPLEFLWNINVLQIMPLEAYIANIHTDCENFQKFKDSIYILCVQDFEENAQYFVQTGILSYIITKAFPIGDSKNSNPDIIKVCLETVESILQGIFLTGEGETAKKFTCLFSLWNAGIVEKESLVNFSSFAISYYVNFLPHINDLEAFNTLETSCSASSLNHLLPVVEKLLSTQTLDRITQVLTQTVKNIEINITSLLVIIQACIKTHKESSVFLSEMVSGLMNEAYEKLNQTALVRSLLIGRQVAYEANIPSHVNYRQWLQAVFNECSRSRSSQSYDLLIQVLSDIVPFYRNIECLKVAIDLNVSVPSNVQNLYADYIILLKTRVQDLKPESKPEETVEKMLTLYESIGKIPPVVLEISLLQKQKFLNEFLPALLIPRVVPQMPDIRERFILALEKAGKIPSNLLQKYRNACLEEEQKIITDIDAINDEFMHEGLEEM